ncbi:MAG TPA: RtcB family protein [Lysobacter sp.]|nr:RtcB family protein [Lysobacter sp.]
MQTFTTPGRAPIKAWVDGVPVEAQAIEQLRNVASLPFIHRHVAVMPDCHVGIGATVGSVVPTRGAIIPAAVGVDIGCGMVAVRTSLHARDLPDSLAALRSDIERAVPHGIVTTPGRHQRGAWAVLPNSAASRWKSLRSRYDRIEAKHPKLRTKGSPAQQLGSLGGGNHFIEVCLDESDRVWIMLHSGSRGVGNRIGTYFIDRAREEMMRHRVNLPDRDLAYFTEGSTLFDDYWDALDWVQTYAAENRLQMLDTVLQVMRTHFPGMSTDKDAVNCHHNYVSRERHFGEDILVTRKGAVSAQAGQLGIIPGSMGARSFIVRGKGHEDAFCSCSHGAGRVMSRGRAKEAITLAQHVEATRGIECRKDAGVIDESPAAYKDIDAVMAAQADLVSIEHTLRQVVCVKG